jgi:cytochrome c oxidase subunit II
MNFVIASLFNLFQAAAPADAPALPKMPESPQFWMPRASSTVAGGIDWLFEVMVWLSVICALLILGAMIHFSIKYRATSRAANERVEMSTDHNTTLEITWSVIPLIVVVALFVWGFKGYVDLRTMPKDAVEVRATGQKWKWIFEYPNGLTDDTLHAPVNTNVRVVISAVDVLHSLYMPNFRTKMDAVPGRYTELWFNATEPGVFPIFCAEYCGTSHSDMLANVVVHEPGGYEQYLEKAAEKIRAMPPVERGKLIYEKQGCATCHTIDGSTKIGPSWKGVWGKQETLTNGQTVTVDENYIMDSVNDPQGKIVQGFPPSMPTYKGKLKDYEIEGLIAFIKSLK